LDRPDALSSVLDPTNQANFFFKNKYFYPIDLEPGSHKVSLSMPSSLSFEFQSQLSSPTKHIKKYNIPWSDFGDRIMTSLTFHFEDGTFVEHKTPELYGFRIRDDFSQSLSEPFVKPL
jgi:hypothetical protein